MDFIGKWYLEDLSVCDELIDYFHNDPWAQTNQKPGIVYDGNKQVSSNRKKSTDLALTPDRLTHPLMAKYIEELFKIMKKYEKKFTWCSKFGPVGMLQGYNIQYYKPGEGFFEWHTERSHGNPPNALRHLVFMTYLNNVTDKGETEWFYQNVKIKPKKGLTVIWPADWTHVHRGVPSPSQHKYIATGWLHFIPKEFLENPQS